MNYPSIGLGYKATTCQLAPPDREEFLRGYLVSATLSEGKETTDQLYCCMCGENLEFHGSSFMCSRDSKTHEVVYLISHESCIEELRDFIVNNQAILKEWFLNIPREIIVSNAKKGSM